MEPWNHGGYYISCPLWEVNIILIGHLGLVHICPDDRSCPHLGVSTFTGSTVHAIHYWYSEAYHILYKEPEVTFERVLNNWLCSMHGLNVSLYVLPLWISYLIYSSLLEGSTVNDNYVNHFPHLNSCTWGIISCKLWECVVLDPTSLVRAVFFTNSKNFVYEVAMNTGA